MTTAHRTKHMKSFLEMTDEEKRDATRVFDEEFIIDTFRELTPQERAEWEKLQRTLKLSNPKLSYQSVKVRLPLSLVKEIDALAKKRKVSRSKMILLGLGVFLAREREKPERH